MAIIGAEFEYYADVLRVPYDVTIAELKNVYEETMRFLHPKNGGSAALSQAIGYAFGALLQHLEEKEAAEDARPPSAVNMPDEVLDDDDSAAPEQENAQPADEEVMSSFGALSDDNREAEMAPQKPTPHAASRKTRRKGRTLQQCHVCSKKLRDKCDLRRHQRTHAGEKAQPKRERKQQCQECGKMFRDKYDLRAHQRTHTGKKPLRREECQEGGNMFCAKRDLRRRQQQHTAEKQRPSGANSDSCGRRRFARRPQRTMRLRSD